MREDEPASPRSIIIRPKAVADIEHQAAYLEDNAEPAVAARFRASIMDAIDRLAFMPGIGSPRETINPRLSGLRMGSVPGFRNYLLFYLTPEGSIEIIRLLHGAQDIAAILEEES